MAKKVDAVRKLRKTAPSVRKKKPKESVSQKEGVPEEEVKQFRKSYFKGEGKGGNLGLPVEAPTIPVAQDTVAGKAEESIPAAPKANTKEMVQDMFASG